MGCTTELKPRQQPYGYRRRSDHVIGQPRKCFRWRGFQSSARPGMFRVAKQQRNVPKSLKAQLIKDAGDKCANPGCSNWRVHLHHIKHWAVYKTHDGKHMIAICPSCHDAVHTSRIDDETLYRWKSISRPAANEIRDHLYVEPSPEIRCLTGSMCVLADSTNALVFTLSNSNHFGFRVRTAISFCRIALCEICRAPTY